MKIPANPIWEERSLRPTPNSTALGTAARNLTATITARSTRVIPATLSLVPPRWTIDARNGARTTATRTAMAPETVKKTEAVRITLARPSLSPMAVILATRWTVAVDTPTSSTAR